VRDVSVVAGVLAASLAYAVLRYNVFGDVSVEQIPVFVANKAISVASLAMLGISGVVADKARRKHAGLLGLALALAHLMLSLLVLDPAYLPKHYLETGRMRWNGEASMLAGIVATVLVLWLGHVTTTRPATAQVPGTSLVPGVGRIVLLLVAVHTLLLGYGAWLDVGGWPGAMPPITLLSFAGAIGFVLLRRRR